MSGLDAARQAAAVPQAEGLPKFTFDVPGTELYGQVITARYGVTTPHGVGHLLEVRDHVAGDVTVWLSNVQLQAGIVEGRNQLGRPVQGGDIVYIRFESLEPRPGGKTLKNFAINVAAGQAPAQQPVQQPVQQVGQQAPVYAQPEQAAFAQAGLQAQPFPSPV